jgi:hypothetical protein
VGSASKCEPLAPGTKMRGSVDYFISCYLAGFFVHSKDFESGEADGVGAMRRPRGKGAHLAGATWRLHHRVPPAVVACIASSL